MAEAFGLVPEAAIQIVKTAIRERVDSTGYRVLPVPIDKTLTYDNQTGEHFAWNGSYTDYTDGNLAPLNGKSTYTVTDTDGNEWCNSVEPFNPHNALYADFTGKTVVNLNRQQLAKIQDNLSHLHAIATTRGLNPRISNSQIFQSFQFTDNQQVIQDFDPLRVYIPSGVNAIGVAARILDTVAVPPSNGKVWIPNNFEGVENFRSDTPIFAVNTFEQLRSLLATVRYLRANGKLPLATSKQSPIGVSVAGVPGVYVGQSSHKGDSFNGDMAELFSDSVSRAVREDNPKTGESISDEWILETSQRMIYHARNLASQYQRDSRHHAFIQDAPIRKILASINPSIGSLH